MAADAVVVDRRPRHRRRDDHCRPAGARQPLTFDGERSQPSLRDAGADDTSDRNGRDANGTGGYDALSGLVLLVGIYNGFAPFIARLVFDGNLLFALPLRLAAPWWWLTSLAVIVTTVILLAVIDNAKQHDIGD